MDRNFFLLIRLEFAIVEHKYSALYSSQSERMLPFYVLKIMYPVYLICFCRVICWINFLKNFSKMKLGLPIMNETKESRSAQNEKLI